MAFKDFSSDQYIRTFDTDEKIRMGSFKTPSSGELGNIRVLLYVIGTLAGNEQIRTVIYPSEDQELAYATSDWMNLSDLVDENDLTVSGNWIGMIRTDFSRENINANNTYYIQCEIRNYTPNFPTLEIGLSHDFPSPRYATSETLFQNTNLAFEIFTYREYGQ
jgi:hypothetical protein